MCNSLGEKPCVALLHAATISVSRYSSFIGWGDGFPVWKGKAFKNVLDKFRTLYRRQFQRFEKDLIGLR